MHKSTEQLKQRCKTFALRVMRLVRALPSDNVATAIGNQLVRSGTSVAANYRAACIGKSRKDFINKLRIAAEEADESALWMELIIEDSILPEKQVSPLQAEASELTAIFLSSIKTARSNEDLSRK